MRRLYSRPYFTPEPAAPSGPKPGRGILIPPGYLHLGKCEHSEVTVTELLIILLKDVNVEKSDAEKMAVLVLAGAISMTTCPLCSCEFPLTNREIAFELLLLERSPSLILLATWCNSHCNEIFHYPCRKRKLQRYKKYT